MYSTFFGECSSLEKRSYLRQWDTGTCFIKKDMPTPLPYFKVNICPFPLPHFASIFFAYL